MNKNLKKISKFLSLVLRHKPEEIGIRLDQEGWTDIEGLLGALKLSGTELDHQTLMEIVRTSDKKRFAVDQDETKIRANQGHSVPVDLNLQPLAPPEFLYHGTVQKSLESILNTGLSRGSRHHVHLSDDIPTAQTVGSRRGRAIILKIHSRKMHAEGYPFFRSKNGVWLAESVEPRFIEKLDT